MMGIAAAALALAACGGAEGTDARAAAAPAEQASAEIAAADAGGSESAAARAAAPADTSLGFRLHESRPGSVDSITVTRGGGVVQTLRPSENEVPADRELERISRVDLDYDGRADLAFVTELSMAGSRSEYWRWDPAAGRFASAGVYETLQPDSAAREFTTHIRGGHAGRLWTASRWRWMDGALAEVRREEQDVAEDGDAYVHVVHELRNGTLIETSRDTLEGEAVRAGATWMAP